MFGKYSKARRFHCSQADKCAPANSCENHIFFIEPNLLVALAELLPAQVHLQWKGGIVGRALEKAVEPFHMLAVGHCYRRASSTACTAIHGPKAASRLLEVDLMQLVPLSFFKDQTGSPRHLLACARAAAHDGRVLKTGRQD